MTGKFAATLAALTFIAFMVIVMAAVLLEIREDRFAMEACVQSGKEWVRDWGNHYECVEVG